MVNQPMESADTVAIATRSELGGRGWAFGEGFGRAVGLVAAGAVGAGGLLVAD